MILRVFLTLPVPRGRDSLDNPLLGFRPPSWFNLSNSAAGLSAVGTSLGFRSPSACKEEESYVKTSKLAKYPRCCRVVLTIPTANYDATLGFLNLLVTCSFLNRPAILRQVTLMGFSLQGFLPLTKPQQLIAADIPSWRFSFRVASSRPSIGNVFGRVSPRPRMIWRIRLWSPSGF
jgi:hypothetical protein